jgi:5-methylcytosine-specific restriction endonuclease McrA
MFGPKPAELPDIDPTLRGYPGSYRDAAIRASWDAEKGGIVCSSCNVVFATRASLRQLQADHVQAFARGGLTTWENLQLLCRSCNLRKGAG